MKDANFQFQRILEDRLCIGCGLCQSMARKDQIKMQIDQQGFIKPTIQSKLDQQLVSQIYQACPSTFLQGLPESEIDETAKLDKIWGYYHRIINAWASDPMIRFQGSTGGVLTALAIYLLESKKVDFILHAKASKDNPHCGEATISQTKEDVLQTIGSRYGPTAVLSHIDEYLDRNQPFAIIAKPCDIAALRNYAHMNPKVNQLVRYWLSLVCGGFMHPNKIKQICQIHNMNQNDVVSIRYRGNGCPGPTVITFKNGSERTLSYTEFWGEDESGWLLPFRCKICADGIGEAADLVAADTWIGGSPNPNQEQNDEGVNAVLTRTLKGEKLFHGAIQDGYLNVGSQISTQELSQYQPHQVNKKQVVYARFAGLKENNRLTPIAENLRIKELAEHISKENFLKQKNGTIARLEKDMA